MLNIGDRVHEVLAPACPADREPTQIAEAPASAGSSRPSALPA